MTEDAKGVLAGEAPRSDAIWRGLTSQEVGERTAAGHVNTLVEPPGRSLRQIISANVFTSINAIMIVLFILVIVSGHYRDGLFVGVVVSNSIVGVVQEVRVRRELARLRVLDDGEIEVVRDEATASIPAAEIVVDDLVKLSAGLQLPVDGHVIESIGMKLDESALTGESLPVTRDVGDDVMSGSFVVTGSGTIRATAVGASSYAAALTSEAKVFNSAESQLRKAIDRILSWLIVIIPVASILLLLRLLQAEDRWQDALQGTVGAAVAMVPDGLVLLTSLAFVAGVLELARHKALASRLSTVEVLARVDVLCVDKTGTITTGDMSYLETHLAADHTQEHAQLALAALASTDEAPNMTMKAIINSVGTYSRWQAQKIEPFSSARKWSAAEFADHGWYYLGAPDVLLEHDAALQPLVIERSSAGRRLLALARSDAAPDGDVVPEDLQPVAILELEDEIRADAFSTLEYFARQDVAVKVISGDNQNTVAAIAKRVGINVESTPIDARSLNDAGRGLEKALADGTVFGRVTPHQKQEMVHALQRNGHVVAMTGDGINDLLALKDADLGIAMGSGTEATRSVADLVLVDDSFATLPVVVDEGRKVINNVERVANLFVSKACYAVLLTALVGIVGSPFPLLPRQLTLIGTLSIGLPGLALALAPEVTRVKAGFLNRVLRFSLPAGVIAGTATYTAYELARRQTAITLVEARTLTTLTLLAIGLAVLIATSRPLAPWKFGLAAAMAALYGLTIAIPWSRQFFELALFDDMSAWLISGVAAAIASALILVIPRSSSEP